LEGPVAAQTKGDYLLHGRRPWIAEEMSSRSYVIASLIPALAFGLAGSLAFLNMFLPAMPVISVLFAFSSWMGIVLGCFLNWLLFVVADAYLPVLVSRAKSPTWAWVPSLAALAVLIALSVWFYAIGLNYAIEYEGIVYFKVYALVALWSLGVAILWIRRIIKDSSGRGVAETARRALWFNAYLHVLLLLVAFPYFGELP
jgi:hypothetical protein